MGGVRGAALEGGEPLDDLRGARWCWQLVRARVRARTAIPCRHEGPRHGRKPRDRRRGGAHAARPRRRGRRRRRAIRRRSPRSAARRCSRRHRRRRLGARRTGRGPGVRGGRAGALRRARQLRARRLLAHDGDQRAGHPAADPPSQAALRGDVLRRRRDLPVAALRRVCDVQGGGRAPHREPRRRGADDQRRRSRSRPDRHPRAAARGRSPRAWRKRRSRPPRPPS